MSEDSDKFSLTLRFKGRRLSTQGMPIYELGTAFVAVQRIINKAYLAFEDRLEKGGFPQKLERERLALQISERRRASDFYGLTPILTDPLVLHALTATLEHVFDAISKYALEKVFDAVTGENDDSKRQYIGSIHADVVNIVNRIDNVGGCESIEIGSPRRRSNKPITFTRETRDYVRALPNNVYLGREITLTGILDRFDPSAQTVSLRLGNRRKCKLIMNADDFDTVRYSRIHRPKLTVIGRARLRIGADDNNFNEFDVSKIKSVDDLDAGS